jgi:hypothetical protein
MAGLGEIHGNRRFLYRWKGYGNSDRIDVGKIFVAIVLIDRHEAFGITKTG